MQIKPGILWMLCAAFLFALMGVCVKAATETASTAQAVFFRAAVGLPFLHAWAARQKIPVWGVGRRELLLVRGILGFLSMALYFFAISRIPLGNASILNATSPIFVILLAGPLLGEKVNSRIYPLLPLFLAGVLAIVKPSWSLDWLPSLAALVSGLTGSLAYVSVRKLGRTQSSTTVVLYFSWVSLLGSVPWVIADWKPLTSDATVFLVLAGLLATAGQMAMTRAYKLEKASVASLFSYTGPVFAFLLALLFFGERPDLWAILGTALIIACAFRIYTFKN